jgi:hypothetical protein
MTIADARYEALISRQFEVDLAVPADRILMRADNPAARASPAGDLLPAFFALCSRRKSSNCNGASVRATAESSVHGLSNISLS